MTVKSTGTIRRMDELGRIVLPVELRRTLDIAGRDEIEISLEDDRIVLQKLDRSCVFCSAVGGLVFFKGKGVCTKCLQQIREG